MLLNISQYSAETLQEQIVSQIRAAVLSGEVEPDQPLMSIRELSQSLRIGINTVQRAYEVLAREGLIYSRPGKGFFAAPLAPDDKQALASERFRVSVRKFIADARKEGLSEEAIRRLFEDSLDGKGK